MPFRHKEYNLTNFEGCTLFARIYQNFFSTRYFKNALVLNILRSSFIIKLVISLLNYECSLA